MDIGDNLLESATAARSVYCTQPHTARSVGRPPRPTPGDLRRRAASRGGLNGPALGVPASAVLTLVVLTVAFNLYTTSVQDVHDAPAPLVTREMPRYLLPDATRRIQLAPALPAAATVSEKQLATEARPVVKVGG
ncbi:hypothetical protein [Streptomyces sp. NBC_01455]|uniref:hypothetical protein n=1 Tax=Streptomyces sp. NBC_01455 TaxID=2903874 RepID=UPI002E30F406|nr:hypothetical protein [Streptomyces sp. NBC_01455]